MTVYEFHRLVAPEKKPLQETDQFWVNFDPVDINYQLKKYDVLVGIGHRHEKAVLGKELHTLLFECHCLSFCLSGCLTRRMEKVGIPFWDLASLPTPE